MDGGFIDLRQSADSSTGNDSFWPSFTDIMMVIVMIFMIASTALMLRNQELVEKLRETILSELQAEERARSMVETSATLEEQLAAAQHASSVLRIKLMRVNERNQALTTQLSTKEQQVLALETGKQQLQADLAQSRRQMASSEENLLQSREELARQAAALAALQQRHDDTLAELAQGEARQQRQEAELVGLRLESSLSEQQLMALQDEYSDLQVRYDKLFKPARSAKGRHVVTVRYWKEAGNDELRIKDTGETDYRSVSREALYEQLDALKKKYPKQLYIKLIIPDDSGLSYNEAWGFTVEILDKYDYYQQK